MLKKFAIAVCIFHFIVVIGLTIHHFATKRFRPAKPIIVRTIVPEAPKPAVVVKTTEKKTIPVQNKTAAKSIPQPKPLSPKVTAKSKGPERAITQSPHGRKEPQNEGRIAALREIVESLDALNDERGPSTAILKVPEALKTQTEVDSLDRDSTYGTFLVAFLQEALDLPEYGEVKAKLEINRFGELVRFEILETKSRANAEFLKKRLPDLTFPCLNDTQTFTITFRNVEMVH